MPNYSLAIFDFDGTLADSLPWFFASLDETADHFGLKRIDQSRMDEYRDMSSRDAIKAIGVPLMKVPAISVYIRDRFAEHMADIVLFEGCAEMLAELHAAGVKIAMVSSNAEANVRHVLGRAAWIVDHYACGSSLWGKAEKFRSVLRALKQSPARAIGVGDEVRDVEAARKAGIAAGSITFGYNSRKALESSNPDYLFDDYPALTRAVVGL